MQDHRRISAITLHGCDFGEHVTQMDISYKDRIGYGPEPLLKHGGKHAKPVKSSLLFEIADGEYITEVIITTWKTWTGKVMDTYHTRIGSMKIITNLHRYIQCGSDFDHGACVQRRASIANVWAHMSLDPKSVLVPKKGGALLYFSGAAGSAIDNLQAHWIPVEDF